MPYLTLPEQKIRSSYSASDWAEFVSTTDAQLGEAPGTAAKFNAWLEDIESEINDTLRRRYAVPFVAPVPIAAKKWEAHLLDAELATYRRNAGSMEAQDEGLLARAARAREEMQNAANTDVPAHPELPLRADLPESSGVVKGGPFVINYITAFDYYDALAGWSK